MKCPFCESVKSTQFDLFDHMRLMHPDAVIEACNNASVSKDSETEVAATTIDANTSTVLGGVLHRILDEHNKLGGSHKAIMAGRHICNVLFGGKFVAEDNWSDAFHHYVAARGETP
jgi:hypothetical protein